jgi:hypothetical protein
MLTSGEVRMHGADTPRVVLQHFPLPLQRKSPQNVMTLRFGSVIAVRTKSPGIQGKSLPGAGAADKGPVAGRISLFH